MDETGSVRWLCFEIEKIDWEYSKKININLVYAQAYHLVKTKFDCNLSLDEINENESRNQAFQILSEERQLIQKHFTHDISDYDLLQEEMEEHILALIAILKFLKESNSVEENQKPIKDILSQLPQITKEMHPFVKSLKVHSQNIQQ